MGERTNAARPAHRSRQAARGSPVAPGAASNGGNGGRILNLAKVVITSDQERPGKPGHRKIGSRSCRPLVGTPVVHGSGTRLTLTLGGGNANVSKMKSRDI